MIAIDTKPTTNSLQIMYRDLTRRGRDWPDPSVDSPLVTSDELHRARTQWARRACATYICTGQAASILHQLTLLGAPLDIISGASYTADELTRHLSMTLHVADHLDVTEELFIEERFFPTPAHPPHWESLFCDILEFFGFNLTLSMPVLEAIAAATSDGAIGELATVQAESMAELVGFGRALLCWMGHRLDAQDSARAQSNLAGLFSAFESLCDGSPQLLDELAGLEITVEAQSGNLGTLKPEHHAAIFYHALNASIFPTLDDLGWQGFEAWHRHYRHKDHLQAHPAVIAAIGTSA